MQHTVYQWIQQFHAGRVTIKDAAIIEITTYLEESWYTARIEKLMYHYNKTLNSFGDYVEK